MDFKEILVKLFEAESYQEQIDHWILIAPRAKIIGNVPEDMIDQWNITQKFPFKIQLWTKDTDIRQFFGLESTVYDRWIDHPANEVHPSDWTQEKKRQIKESWLRRLDPPLRLPQAWAKYVIDASEIGLFIENDDRKCLRELWQKKEYIPVQALDSSRSPLPSSLAETVRTWLDCDGTRVCIVLGDFGDGKSAFTYMFARELLARYIINPRAGWIPVRFPLRRFARPKFNSRDFLRDRLEELGSNVSEWKDLIERKNILVMLDGMDEMTKNLGTKAIKDTIDLITDCCNNEFEGVKKIILTCRTPFFEELTQRQYIEDKLSKPRILYIERFDRRQVYDKLDELATTSRKRQILHELRQKHDPIGLAGKALFFKMVLGNLENANSDFSSETAIYQTYIDNSLTADRKLELLEKNFNQTNDELKAGLLKIMDHIAMEIHLSNKDYICLRKFDCAPQEGLAYAKFLWQTVDDDESRGEDALHRVGVRSLLHKKTQGVDKQDTEAWPVEFCHRSIQEYFVAHCINEALKHGISSASEIISKVDFNYEILRFTAELMKKSGYNYQRTLRELAFMSRIDHETEDITKEERQRRARLGRTSITLLYRWLEKIVETDWSNLILDGAQLAGADLTGKNFQNTSLVSANLNNAVLNNADFSGANLTDVRLEKTGEVRSLSVPRNLDGFFAAYRDGSIRKWNLSDRSGAESRIIYELRDASKNDDKSLQVVALPGEDLCLYDREHVFFLNAGRCFKEVGTFETQKRYLNVVFSEQRVMTIEKGLESGCNIRVFDFLSDGVPAVKDLSVDACVYCGFLGDKGVIAALNDGRLVIYFSNNEKKGVIPEFIQITEFSGPSGIASICVDDTEQKEFLVACGGRDGTIGLWRIFFGDSSKDVDYRELFRKSVHQSIVTSLSFIGPENLLTGGNDNKIFLLDILNKDQPGSIKNIFELKLRCKGLKLDGLKSERERAILEAAIEL